MMLQKALVSDSHRSTVEPWTQEEPTGGEILAMLVRGQRGDQREEPTTGSGLATERRTSGNGQATER